MSTDDDITRMLNNMSVSRTSPKLRRTRPGASRPRTRSRTKTNTFKYDENARIAADLNSALEQFVTACMEEETSFEVKLNKRQFKESYATIVSVLGDLCFEPRIDILLDSEGACVTFVKR